MKCMVCDGEGVFQDECCVHCFGYGFKKNWIENLIQKENIFSSDFIFYSEIRKFMLSMVNKYDLNSKEAMRKEINEFIVQIGNKYKLKYFVICDGWEKNLYLTSIIDLPYKDKHVSVLISTNGSEDMIVGNLGDYRWIKK